MITKMTTKTVVGGLVLGAAMLASGAASAQDWRGNGYGYRDQRAIDAELIGSTCSGQRGQAMENHLNREVRDGRINRYKASQIHRQIDQLQYREQIECRQRDWGAARNIGKDYISLRVWIDREAANGYSFRPRNRGW
ncbi:MAG: hypothetical protein B7Z36_05330 [Novosphingobium sp. 12-63-9]|nr:MAG: hypothetical protein B7Z36_05330 [Novosphingobium sp. 12-63-9]